MHHTVQRYLFIEIMMRGCQIMKFLLFKMAGDKSNGCVCVVSWLVPEQLLNKQVPPLNILSELMLHCKMAHSWILLG